MKKVVCILAAVTLFLAISANALAATWIVDAPNGVFVRDPVTHGHIYTSDGKEAVMGYGRTIDVEWYDNYWLYFTYNGQPAMVYREYAHIANPEELVQIHQNGGRLPLTNEAAIFVGIATSDLKVVKDPDKSTIRYGTIEQGETVYVRALGKYWYKIVYNNAESAYVESSKVSLIDLNIPGEGVPYRTKGDNSTNKFSIREEPSFEAIVIVNLEFGTYVKVVETIDSTWVKVIYNSKGDTGYMRRIWLNPTTLFNP